MEEKFRVLFLFNYVEWSKKKLLVFLNFVLGKLMGLMVVII